MTDEETNGVLLNSKSRAPSVPFPCPCLSFSSSLSPFVVSNQTKDGSFFAWLARCRNRCVITKTMGPTDPRQVRLTLAEFEFPVHVPLFSYFSSTIIFYV